MNEDYFKVLELIQKDIDSLHSGEHKEIICPICQGQMTISKSSNNGSVHIRCKGCEFYLRY